MRRAAGQGEPAGRQRRRLDAAADGREALAQARDAAPVSVALCTRDAVVRHPYDDVVALAAHDDLAALGAGVAQEVRRAFADERAEQLVALDEALGELAAESSEKANLVRLRYFAGFSHQEAAEALGISSATADRYWAYAKVFLRCEMEDAESQ